MRTNNQSRPTYKYQAQRQRQIWQPQQTWESSWGRCTAIAKNADNTFQVQVEKGGKTRWLPVESVLNEPEVIEWIRRNKTA